MAKIIYQKWRPNAATMTDLVQAERIATEYADQGYDLTLRQLYYQFVARGIIPNSDKSYKRLGEIVNRGRLAGFIDWDHITDRTRNLAGITHWRDPAHIIRATSNSYYLDTWANQPARVEVWVEKEALAGVVSRAARRADVDYFSCRGYVSQSELWSAGQRLRRYIEGGQRVVVLHLGDHDPSGIDMSRDIRDRLRLFINNDLVRNNRSFYEGAVRFTDIEERASDFCTMMYPESDGMPALEIRRIALNMDQVEEYAPPPNPAKLSDSRAADYVSNYGDESWELDALDPRVLDDLITEHIDGIVDEERMAAMRERMESEREVLTEVSNRWSEVGDFLQNPDEWRRD